MKYNKLKSLLLSSLDKLPSSLGYRIYHKIQKHNIKNLEAKIIANKTSIDKILSILSKDNRNLKGKDILEIGSGWMPMMPL